jgi:hypothetical protein
MRVGPTIQLLPMSSNTKNSTSSRIKGNTPRYKDTYGRVLPYNLSHHHSKTLYVVHNTSHA